jgi:CheY-like chemotaxis protein
MADGTGDGRRGLHGLKVLVVEDDAVIAFDLEATLRGFGCEVLSVVPSATDALEALRAERPDAALLDLSLADGRATPVAEALVAAGVPFALVTGYDGSRIGEPVLRAAPHLDKPYGRAALREALALLSAQAG